MTYRVDVTDNAKAAIDEFIFYIAHTRQEPINATRVLDAIWQAVPTLENMPHRCPKAPEDAYFDYTVRMLIVKKTLLLLYRVDDTKRVVEVFGFRHAAKPPHEEGSKEGR